RDLKARGIAPVFYPFVLMDIPAGNSLPDPWGGGHQPPHPWRGRITCHPAPGRDGSPDATAAAATQIEALLGRARVSDFSISGDAVRYHGDPDDWGFRRFILHYAHLCRAAGGVEAFLIGSELVSLCAVRDAPGSYPFVRALKTLAADVRRVLGADVKISYAADWSEWSGHIPPEGNGAFCFHLDPLWADTNIDFIGIDNYMPLADWRDGMEHLDAAAGARGIHDLDYLKSNIAGGEYFDWYYRSRADRDAQVRTPITDGARHKPWIWRRKDLVSWWSKRHYDRIDGTESTTSTPWVPRSKPIWFTELGCPAVDKGPNQPNVFYDPKSSESALPWYSTGVRDDAVQRQFLLAHFEWWNTPGDHNPVSPSYGGRMVDPARIFVWAWDARPWPAWPTMSDVWGDGDNHELGHWLNGRLGQAPLTELVERLLEEGGLPPSRRRVEELGHMITGFVVDGPRATRQVLEPLMRVFDFDAAAGGDVLRVFPRAAAPVATIDAGELAERGEGEGGDGPAPLFEITREEETALPAVMRLHYFEEGADHRSAVAEAALPTVASRREEDVTLAVSMRQQQAAARAQVMLAAARAGRETLTIALPPRWLALEPGDVLRIDLPGESPSRLWRIEEITDELRRRLVLRAFDPAAHVPAAAPRRARRGRFPRPVGPPTPLLLDLPHLRAEDVDHGAWLALHAAPWPGPVAVLRGSG
ncbi:MAG TPA: hypothetical protein ENK13_00685, partial [Thermopetrobacter sp.]|nr:hypothetical protein [Thermopetrobacter sp.]